MQSNLEDVKDLTLEDLVELHEQFKQEAEVLDAGIQTIKDELLDRLKEMKLSGTKTKNGYLISKVIKKTYAQAEIGQARELGALQTKEVIDTSKIKQLVEKGIEIRGVKTVVYISIKEVS